MTAQDVSTMIRCGQKNIIFLINNGGYTIEVEIHDGPYNVIKNWNYTGLVDAICNGEGNCWTTKVYTYKFLRPVEYLIITTETRKGAKTIQIWCLNSFCRCSVRRSSLQRLKQLPERKRIACAL